MVAIGPGSKRKKLRIQRSEAGNIVVKLVRLIETRRGSSFPLGPI
jgi:hypothetical protein